MVDEETDDKELEKSSKKISGTRSELSKRIQETQAELDALWDDGGYWPAWKAYKDFVELRFLELKKYYEEEDVEKLVEVMEKKTGKFWKVRDWAIRFIVLLIRNGKQIPEHYIGKIAERIEKVDESPYIRVTAIKALKEAKEPRMEVPLEKIEELLTRAELDALWDYQPWQNPYDEDYVELKFPELKKYYEEKDVEKLVEIMEKEGEFWKVRELGIRFIALLIKNGEKIPEPYIEKIAERLEKDEPYEGRFTAIKALRVAMEYGMEVPLEKVAEQLSSIAFNPPIESINNLKKRGIDWRDVDWSFLADEVPYDIELEPFKAIRWEAVSILERAIELGKEIPIEVILKKLEHKYYIVREETIEFLLKAAEAGVKIPLEKLKERLEDEYETENIRLLAYRILEALGYEIEIPLGLGDYFL